MRLLIVLGFFSILTTHAQTLTVFAASSLTEAFTELANTFEAEHPGIDIVLNFAGSSTLATQIEQGAPADLFASADWSNILRVAEENDARVFATNTLVVVTPVGSPVTTLETLATEEHLLVLAGEDVPAGHYAIEVLERLKERYGPSYSEDVLAHLASRETNVRQVAAKVALGEADAALVYATDAKTLQDVSIIEIPEAYNLRVEYPIVHLSNSENNADVQPFLEFLFSPQGQKILATYGFSPP